MLYFLVGENLFSGYFQRDCGCIFISWYALLFQGDIFLIIQVTFSKRLPLCGTFLITLHFQGDSFAGTFLSQPNLIMHFMFLLLWTLIH